MSRNPKIHNYMWCCTLQSFDHVLIKRCMQDMQGALHKIQPPYNSSSCKTAIAKLPAAVAQAVSHTQQTSSAVERNMLEQPLLKHALRRLGSDLIPGGADALEALFVSSDEAASAVDSAAAAALLAVLHKHLLALNAKLQALEQQNQLDMAAARAARFNQQALNTMRANVIDGKRVPKISINWQGLELQSEQRSADPLVEAPVLESGDQEGDGATLPVDSSSAALLDRNNLNSSYEPPAGDPALTNTSDDVETTSLQGEALISHFISPTQPFTMRCVDLETYVLLASI